MKRILERISLFWLLQLGGWGGYAIVLVTPDLVSLTTSLTRRYMVFQTVGFLCNFTASSFVLRPVCRRQWLAGLRFPRSFLIVFACCAVLAYMTTTVALIAMTASAHLLTPSLRFSGLLGNLPGAVYAGLVLVSWCGIYFGIKYYQAVEAERQHALAAEWSAREAQLSALRYQIHPHFLFNTLNSISALILEGEADAATSMIARVADYLRATLDGKSTHEVPLREELFLTEQYLAIEKLRLGERLEIEMNVNPSISDCLVPNLVLQLLVENAIRLGIAPLRGIGRLTIQAERSNDKLVINVKDNGLGRISRSEEENGNGRRARLADIELRISELYGEKGRFNVRWPSEGGCHVLLEMPYRA